MSTPAEDKGPSLQDAAKQIAQSITDAFSGLFDYEGHSNRDRNYWQKGPGPEDTETWKHKYKRAIEARDSARKERDELQDYLDKIRGPITESADQMAAREWVRSYIAGEVDPDDALAGTRSIQALTTVLDDLKMWKDAYVESLNERDRVKAERDRWQSEHSNVTRLLNEQSEAVRKSQPKPLGLTDQLARLDKVITDQVEAVGNGSTLSKAANIRRLQVRDFDSEHDRTHGWSLLSQAAHALLMRAEHEWPWDDVTPYRKLAALPLADRCAHAAALICAAGDVAKAEGM